MHFKTTKPLNQPKKPTTKGTACKRKTQPLNQPTKTVSLYGTGWPGLSPTATHGLQRQDEAKAVLRLPAPNQPPEPKKACGLVFS